LANFTKGPWHIESWPSGAFGEFLCIVPDATLRTTDTIAQIVWSTQEINEEARANADLMAAAPELADAVERLLANDGISNREFARAVLQKAVRRDV
jgi:hypothetical protein